MKHLFVLTSLLLTLSFVNPIEAKQTSSNYNDFKKNPYVSSSEKSLIKPYLLPSDHPIKPALDAIFLTTRATSDQDALIRAGFEILVNQPRSFILVVRHATLPGYLIKLHLDNDHRKKHGIAGWQWFLKRINGANSIRACIAKNKMAQFKVPKKWMYPLPLEPKSPAGKKRKNFILIVEDMNLLSRRDNHHAWYNFVTKEHLDNLRLIFKKCGGGSYRASNIPFSKDGKICFIDTEYPGKKASTKDIEPYLNPDMLQYWKKINHDE